MLTITRTKRIKALDRDTTQIEKNTWNLRNRIVFRKEIIIWQIQGIEELSNEILMRKVSEHL